MLQQGHGSQRLRRQGGLSLDRKLNSTYFGIRNVHLFLLILRHFRVSLSVADQNDRIPISMIGTSGWGSRPWPREVVMHEYWIERPKGMGLMIWLGLIEARRLYAELGEDAFLQFLREELSA